MKKEVSLKQFIDETYHLLTVIGVFVALTTLFSSSVFKSYQILSFTAEIMLLLLVFDLFIDAYKRFIINEDKEKPTITLTIFIFCFIWLIGGIYLQVIYANYELIKRLLIPIIGIMNFILVISLINKYRIIKKINKKHKWFETLMHNYLSRKMILLLIFSVVLILTFGFIKLILYLPTILDKII